jgi:hypothetical protein
MFDCDWVVQEMVHQETFMNTRVKRSFLLLHLLLLLILFLLSLVPSREVFPPLEVILK